MNLMAFQNNHSGLKRWVIVIAILTMLLPFKHFGQEPAVIKKGIETGKENLSTGVADNPKRKNWIQESVQDLREMMRTG